MSQNGFCVKKKSGFAQWSQCVICESLCDECESKASLSAASGDFLCCSALNKVSDGREAFSVMRRYAMRINSR